MRLGECATSHMPIDALTQVQLISCLGKKENIHHSLCLTLLQEFLSTIGNQSNEKLTAFTKLVYILGVY